MASLFDNLGTPLVQGPGSVSDYKVDAGERMANDFANDLENSPFAELGRMARRTYENNAPFFGGESNMVTPQVAKEELKARGLDSYGIDIPETGISRYDLDMKQYLKQQEIQRQSMSERPQSFFSHAAGLAGSFAAQAVDPINVASAFIPIVPELRAEAWIAKQGLNRGGRAAVRAGIGAAEGAVGGALVEPINYLSAQQENRQYGIEDSFANIVFGGIIGGGLHPIGGAVYDWRMGRAIKSMQDGLGFLNFRDMSQHAGDQAELDTLRAFTDAFEHDEAPPHAADIINQGLTPEMRERLRASQPKNVSWENYDNLNLGEVMKSVKSADDVGPPTNRETGQPLGKGLDELRPEADADRTKEAFNRQFLDKLQQDIVPGLGETEIRPPREDIFEVAQANFVGDTTHTAKMVPIDQLDGGVRMSDQKEAARVQEIADTMKTPAGYVERLIVDDRGRVIEGQHRLEALRQLGVSEVPVIEISEKTSGFPVDDMREAAARAGLMHSDQIKQIVDHAADAIREAGGVAEARKMFDAPRGYERVWNAVMDAADKAPQTDYATDMVARIHAALEDDAKFEELIGELEGRPKSDVLSVAKNMLASSVSGTKKEALRNIRAERTQLLRNKGQADMIADLSKGGGYISMQRDIAGEGTESPGFKTWSGGLDVVEDGADYQGGPAVFNAYHGTTHDVYVFKKQGRYDNFLGQGPYFTTSRLDGDANYAGEGPDLTVRIAQQKENIADSFHDDDFAAKDMIRDYLDSIDSKKDVDDYDLDWLKDQYGDKAIEFAARQQAAGEHQGALMPVFVKLENPADLTGKSKDLTYEVEFDESGDPVRESGTLLQWIDAAREVADEFQASREVNEYITDLLDEGGDVDFGKAFDLASKHFVHVYDPDTGDVLTAGAMFREIAERAGYDGVIMDADKHFGTGRRGFGGASVPGMAGVYPGTLHIVPFKSENVKSSIGNNGDYSLTNADIRYQRDIPEGGHAPGTRYTPGERTEADDSIKPYQPNTADGTKAAGFQLVAGVRGSPGVFPASAAWSDEAPLSGGPRSVKIPGVGIVQTNPYPVGRRIAREWVESQGRKYEPITSYRKVDPARAARIAEAFDQMEHAPNDPRVKAAYAKMVEETLSQWEAIKRSGLQVEFIDISRGDPYASSPRLATEDVINNNHLWVFSTDDGFGTEGVTSKDEGDNPLYKIVDGEQISGRPVRANDIFRIVHDYFGHVKDGIGFRADGEENAWRSHSRMYSPEAMLAMTTETRGQNSWVNYGPHGENNRTAATEGTVFAPQKIGPLPDWVMREGQEDLPTPREEGEPMTLAQEFGLDGMKTQQDLDDMRKPEDGPDAPKVIGVDAAGRPALDFRDSIVSHFTDEEAAADIRERGYQIVGDGYYGEAISFTPNREYGRQFGGLETSARIAPDARILNIGLEGDWKIAREVLDNPRYSPIKRPGVKSWREAFLERGIDGLYDAGAGDLFMYNNEKVWPVEREAKKPAGVAIGTEDGGIDVWHSSPHDFDQFALNKETLGSGEGNQSYHHGLYFAESEAVSGRGGEYWRNFWNQMKPGPENSAANAMHATKFDREKAIQRLESESDYYAEHARPGRYGYGSEIEEGNRQLSENYKQAADILREGKIAGPRTYRAKLYVKPEELLDWDKPLREQSKTIRDILSTHENARRLTGNDVVRGQLTEPTGEAIANRFGRSLEGAQAMLDAGIKGIRYRDAGSRGRDEWTVRSPQGGEYVTPNEAEARQHQKKFGGELIEPKITYNYVIFDDSLVDIIDKFQRSLEEQPDLVAAHNLTAANLLHADKMGGIAAPSIAITRDTQGHDNFGEITLIAPKDLVDPQKGAKVFASDIYSARYPDITHDVKWSALKKLWSEFDEASKDLGHVLSSELSEDEIERKGNMAVRESTAAMLAYAREKKVKIEPTAFDEAAWRKKLDAAVEKERKAEEVMLADPENDEKIHEWRQARNEQNRVQWERDEPKNELRRRLKDMFRNDHDFWEWADQKFRSLNPKEKIFKGFNSQGMRRYMPHNLDNVVKMTTKVIRDGEGFNYGIGNLRAKVTPQFKSVAAIQKAKGRIIDKTAFDKIKDEAFQEFNTIADQLLPKLKYKGNRFGQLDELSNHIAEAIDRNNVKRVLQEYYNDITDDDVRLVGNWLLKLKDMPTTYFEVKLPRAVNIGEFGGAVVPDNMSPKVRELLAKHGITNIREYPAGDVAARSAAINDFRDMKFQHDMETTNLGFYSAVERGLKEAGAKKALGKEWLGMLKNKPGVKAEELEFTGLGDFLTEHADDSLTKEEVLKHASDNAVKLEEVSYGRRTRDNVRPDQTAIDKYEPEWIKLNLKFRKVNEERTAALYAGDRAKADQLEVEYDDLNNQINEVHDKMVEDTISRTGVDVREPKFEQYTLPGGHNYREVLLKIPTFNKQADYLPTRKQIEARKTEDPVSRSWHWETYDTRTGNMIGRHPKSLNAEEAIDQALDTMRKNISGLPDEDFSAAHWAQKNVIAHTRISDRQLPDGTTALHVEEVQSDWHQRGRDKGYKTPLSADEKAELDRLIGEHGDIVDKRREARWNGDKDAADKLTEMLEKSRPRLDELQQKESGGVPNGPFKKSWHELMMKRLIRYAAENGYSKILLTPGQLQADRFDLSKEVSEIRYEKNEDQNLYEIRVFNKNKEEFFRDEDLTADELKEHVGAEMAAKIVNDEGKPHSNQAYRQWRSLSGLDLKVGGEGMKGFYDSILPNFLNKYGKKYGAKVGSENINIRPTEVALEHQFAVRPTKYGWDVTRHDGMAWSFDSEAEANAFVDREVNKTATVHSFPITEQMRKDVMEGQPLFQKDLGAPTPGGGGTKLDFTPLSAEQKMSLEKLMDEVDGLIRKMVGQGVNTKWYDRIRGRERGTTYVISGGYVKLRKLIILTMESENLTRTAKHEAIHALKDLGFFSDAEWDTLVRAAIDGKWLDKKYGSKNTIRERYKNKPLIEQIEEAIAEEFSFGRASLYEGYHPLVRKAMLKIKDFADGLGAAMRKVFGQYSTPEDIFRMAERGELAERQEPTAAAQGPRQGFTPNSTINRFQQDVDRGKEDAIAPQAKSGRMTDTWETEDRQISMQADLDEKAGDETIQDIEADIALLDTHIQSMRGRGILTEKDEAALQEGNAEAKVKEEQAAAYLAVGICEGEA
jgi:hypothetical protein